ncbi:ExbD/TolR family protein [Thiohalomonas denitrificans]|uniref:Biopolymer transport protein ExbD n=1 Tax=Thiohalomonas denitrificans TaxID=415747 RepID=A0A1G5QSA1_9GAMM|nr:biopolymer transporter ExbD [Thiohalomonas denitrificans]SCZ64637.1 Biopolymer transport protein ExbD [Thiohalomonas denitrificans]
MKNTRRMKRMSRAKKRSKNSALNLTSLMDVFTILVFFLLVNQSSTEVLEPPKEIALPDSVVESKPRQTVIMLVSAEHVMVQGEPLIETADVMKVKGSSVEAIEEKLKRIQENTVGLNTAAVAKSKEVTILADKGIPFKILKKLMSTCTSAGYSRISLAVNQKASQS